MRIELPKLTEKLLLTFLFSCLDVFDKLTEKGLTFGGTIKGYKATFLFSCLDVFDKLTEKGFTFGGTIKGYKNLEFLPRRNKEPFIAIYGFVNAKMLLSHIPKKIRTVLLISSRHHSACVDPGSGKACIIATCNKTKSDSDTLDQKLASYVTSCWTSRWPTAVVCAMLAIAEVKVSITHSSQKHEKIRAAFHFYCVFVLTLERKK